MPISKTLSAAIILSVAVATPAFAKGHSRAYNLKDFRGAYNQIGEPSNGSNIQNFGFGGRDRSWVGGVDPSLHPSGS
jgi:hypothetical protein